MENHSGQTLTSATWNGAGNLLSYSSAAGGALSSAMYGGDGRRMSATVLQDGVQTGNVFVWDTASILPRNVLDSNNAYIYAG
jgi:hypothetical protein